MIQTPPERCRMMKTPPEHLPKGYPLASTAESQKYAPIFDRAFEIHATAHDFAALLASASWVAYQGYKLPECPRSGVLGVTEDDPTYCDCYERAYQEFQQYQKLRNIFGPTPSVIEEEPAIPVANSWRRIQIA